MPKQQPGVVELFDDRDALIEEYDQLLTNLRAYTYRLETENELLKRELEESRKEAKQWEGVARTGYPETMDLFFDWLKRRE